MSTPAIVVALLVGAAVVIALGLIIARWDKKRNPMVSSKDYKDTKK